MRYASDIKKNHIKSREQGSILIESSFHFLYPYTLCMNTDSIRFCYFSKVIGYGLDFLETWLIFFRWKLLFIARIELFQTASATISEYQSEVVDMC